MHRRAAILLPFVVIAMLLCSILVTLQPGVLGPTATPAPSSTPVPTWPTVRPSATTTPTLVITPQPRATPLPTVTPTPTTSPTLPLLMSPSPRLPRTGGGA